MHVFKHGSGSKCPWKEPENPKTQKGVNSTSIVYCSVGSPSYTIPVNITSQIRWLEIHRFRLHLPG